MAREAKCLTRQYRGAIPTIIHAAIAEGAKLFDDDDSHPDDCDCLTCAIRLEAQRRIDAGTLQFWEIPQHLIEALAEQIAISVDVGECLRTVELFGSSLRAAVCRHHPQLGARVIHLTRRRDGQAREPSDDVAFVTPADLEGRRLSPGPNPLQGFGHTPLSEGAALATLPQGAAPGQVTPLHAATHRGDTREGAPSRPLRDTVTLAATTVLTAEMLAMMTTQVLRHIWWSCQCWADITAPRSLKAQIAHAGCVDRSARNQLGIEAELERRRQPVPIAPTPTYIVSIRFDQAYGGS
jgi:hypothetical protein